MEKALQILKNEDLLNHVGERILLNWDKMKRTRENWETYFTGKTEKQVLDELATSSLVGADDEQAIQEWVDEDEIDYIYLEKRTAKVQVRNPGGNASKNAKSYSMTLPASWMQQMGITEEDREVTLTFDSERIIIERG